MKIHRTTDVVHGIGCSLLRSILIVCLHFTDLSGLEDDLILP